ncbi:MAG: AAA family ATPase, partial [Desulfovibrionaceae bacterium]|nr:AAA family ATPase [Desulfovibrionaceae bacterium]
MTGLKIPVGIQSFSKMRDYGYCYVDKTALIEELLAPCPPEVGLITRPRRFGKSLSMDMLAEFLDIRAEELEPGSRARLFGGLQIMRNRAICDTWMGKYPVCFLSLQDIVGSSFDDALNRISTLMYYSRSRYNYLTTSDSVCEATRTRLNQLFARTTDINLLIDSLSEICFALQQHWNKKVVLIIDEYDVPLSHAVHDPEYYQQTENFMKPFFSQVLKGNTNVIEFVVMTGCLRITIESLLSGLNNFRCFGVGDAKLADKLGFTPAEVDMLLAQAGQSEKKDLLASWYDGYHFGPDKEIYCPWDIIHYLADLNDDPNKRPVSYWTNTSLTTHIYKLLDKHKSAFAADIQNLVNGGCLQIKIKEKLTFKNLLSDANNIWTLLYPEFPPNGERHGEMPPL